MLELSLLYRRTE